MTILERSLLVFIAAVLLNLLFSSLSPQVKTILSRSNYYPNMPDNVTKVILYGSPMSTCTRRVAVVLKEKGVPYELKALDFSKGEHKGEDYVKNWQPFGQVPALQVRQSPAQQTDPVSH